MSSSRFVPMHTMDREWDARFNLPTDTDIDRFINAVKDEVKNNKFRYVLVGGVEIGESPHQDDYKIQHVHVCLVYNNRTTKSAIIKNLEIMSGYGYYLVPRNKNLPYSGWKAHHIKTATKMIPENNLLFEYGTLPPDRTIVNDIVKRSTQEKKATMNEVIIDLRRLYEEGKDEEAFKTYPRAAVQYGEKIKSLIGQKRDFYKTEGNPNIWITGSPGSGKSAILQVIYPNYYNKTLMNRFFDLFDAKFHTHILLSDVDHNAFETLGTQFFKTICDEAGFPIDQKYKSPMPIHRPVLVSSNFTISDVLPEDTKGRNDTLRALERRFWEVNIRELLRLIGLKLLSKYEINQLKAAGNTDPTRIFMAWDYLRDIPTGEELKAPEEYQKMIKEAYYGKPVGEKRARV